MPVRRVIKAMLDRRRVLRLDAEQLAARNLARFRKLAVFVRERSPYYARVMKSVPSTRRAPGPGISRCSRSSR